MNEQTNNNSLHFVMARCDRKDSTSPPSTEHSATIQNRHDVSVEDKTMNWRKIWSAVQAGFRSAWKTAPTFNKMVSPGLCLERTNQATICELKKTIYTTGQCRINKD